MFFRSQKNVLTKQITEDQHLAASKTIGQTHDIAKLGKDIIISPLHRHRNLVPLLFSVHNQINQANFSENHSPINSLPDPLPGPSCQSNNSSA